jgi:Sigma-70 region 2
MDPPSTLILFLYAYGGGWRPDDKDDDLDRNQHVSVKKDAEDALQDTLLAAWRGLGGFEGRASMHTWLSLPDRHQPLPQRASLGQPTPGQGVGHPQR